MSVRFALAGKNKSLVLFCALLFFACKSSPSARAEPTEQSSTERRKAGGSDAPKIRASAPAVPRPSTNMTAGYPWFDGKTANVPRAVDTLEDRFAPEPGFERVKLESQSFGAFLRRLPLAAANTPVLSNRGEEIRAGDHPNVAAVVAIDVGAKDLQQCADAVIRMHAEWRYARGARDHAYRAASGTRLSFAQFAAGDRLRVDGNQLSFVRSAKAQEPSHELLRLWLDDVFGWANTGALARDAQRVKWENVRPGDFFVLTGVPFGHAVLVVDMAKDARGRKAFLLTQSFVPAQNVHVLRPNEQKTWFVVDDADGAVKTPFWDPFPFDSLRRLPE